MILDFTFSPSRPQLSRPILIDVGNRLSARGLTYNNNAGQLSIEYLRPDPTSQFSKRSYPSVRQLRQHVASQVHRETTPTPGCEWTISPHCPNPKPDVIPTFTGGVTYVYNDVAKVCSVYDSYVFRPTLHYINVKTVVYTHVNDE